MASNPRPFMLAETNWKAVKETRYTTAVLPWGATEAHNYHLPYGTDNYQADHVVERAAEKAWEMGSRLLVLPGIPYGVNTGQLDVDFCMNMMPSTQLAILKDICDVLVRHGVTRLVIFNGHGANNFQPLIRELAGTWSQLFVCSVNWFLAGDRKSVFEEPGDHADELETSVMMHIAPHLVMPLETAGDGANKRFGAEGFRKGWAWAQRPWTRITQDTGSGDPRKATEEKGRIYLQQAVDAIAGFLHEVSTRSVEDMLTY
jgi:creatinine amidohydrolase